VITVEQGPPLSEHPDLVPPARAWLQGHPELGHATDELRRFFEAARASGGSAGPAPAWSDDAAWRGWLEAAAADEPDDESRGQLEHAVAALAAGRAEPVITGQQPGFLGGPLYTLLKIATAVVTAELRTAAGHPSVPLFWAGDDDDDLREALAPVLFDPARGALLRAAPEAADVPGGEAADRMVGALPARQIATGEAAWLLERSETNDQDGVRADLTWGRLQRRALQRTFRRTGLVIVSGDDPWLHESAAPFYAQVWRRRVELRRTLADKGNWFVASGYEAPLGPAAGERFLNLQEHDRRRSLGDVPELPPAARLRPGVALRALVQDWLFRPAAVVAGPSEVAYLKQLEPLHAAFGVARSPLLPRLFAWIVPQGVEAGTSQHAERDEAIPAGLAAAAASVAESAGDVLQAALEREIGTSPGRARQLVSEQGRTWERQTRRLMERELRRQRRRRRPQLPVWLSPGGRRQERSLAAFCAGALWDDDLTAALLHAARRHVDAGLDGHWREFHLTVPQP
jgi:hypothetical protein